jgi:superfamily I DNA and RNA helicase
MASIELDIIKQRSDKLNPEEKRELIEYLSASLADKGEQQRQIQPDIDLDKLTDEDLKLAS